MPLNATGADSTTNLYYNHNKEDYECASSVVQNKLMIYYLMFTQKEYGSVNWLVGLHDTSSGGCGPVGHYVPTHGPDKYKVHNYQAMYDKGW